MESTPKTAPPPTRRVSFGPPENTTSPSSTNDPRPPSVNQLRRASEHHEFVKPSFDNSVGNTTSQCSTNTTQDSSPPVRNRLRQASVDHRLGRVPLDKTGENATSPDSPNAEIDKNPPKSSSPWQASESPFVIPIDQRTRPKSLSVTRTTRVGSGARPVVPVPTPVNTNASCSTAGFINNSAANPSLEDSPKTITIPDGQSNVRNIAQPKKLKLSFSGDDGRNSPTDRSSQGSPSPTSRRVLTSLRDSITGGITNIFSDDKPDPRKKSPVSQIPIGTIQQGKSDPTPRKPHSDRPSIKNSLGDIETKALARTKSAPSRTVGIVSSKSDALEKIEKVLKSNRTDVALRALSQFNNKVDDILGAGLLNHEEFVLGEFNVDTTDGESINCQVFVKSNRDKLWNREDDWSTERGFLSLKIESTGEECNLMSVKQFVKYCNGRSNEIYLPQFDLNALARFGIDVSKANDQKATQELRHFELDLLKLSTEDFAKTNLSNTVISGYDLSGMDFSGKDLTNTQFINCKLEGANFTDAILHGARFTDTNLNHVKFTNAKLGNAQLTNVTVIGAHFNGATLYGTTITLDLNRVWDKGTLLAHFGRTLAEPSLLRAITSMDHQFKKTKTEMMLQIVNQLESVEDILCTKDAFIGATAGQDFFHKNRTIDSFIDFRFISQVNNRPKNGLSRTTSK